MHIRVPGRAVSDSNRELQSDRRFHSTRQMFIARNLYKFLEIYHAARNLPIQLGKFILTHHHQLNISTHRTGAARHHRAAALPTQCAVAGPDGAEAGHRRGPASTASERRAKLARWCCRLRRGRHPTDRELSLPALPSTVQLPARRDPGPPHRHPDTTLTFSPPARILPGIRGDSPVA